MQLEFKRTELIFSSPQTNFLNYFTEEKNETDKLSFNIIDCSRHEGKCSLYGCYGVPAIILTDKRRKHVFRYNGEKSALCERLTSFVIEKTMIHPKSKYYLEKYEEIIYDNQSKFEDKIDKLLYHSNELNIVNFSYIHQFNDLISVDKYVSTGRCVALALPIQGVIPVQARIIFDYFFREGNFYPIVLPSKSSYKIEETLRTDIGIILFTSRGEYPVFINNTIPNIIDIVNYFCFIEGSLNRRKFIEMLINDDTEKIISLIDKSLKRMNAIPSKNVNVNLNLESSKPSSDIHHDYEAKITESVSNEQTDSDVSENLIESDSKTISSSASAFKSTDSSIPKTNNQAEYSAQSPTSSSSESSDQLNYKLPYEFRKFAEDPIKLISFAKMMYSSNNLEYIIYTIDQLRKTIINDKIGKSIEEKLSQRIIVLKVIKQIFLERLFTEKNNEKSY